MILQWICSHPDVLEVVIVASTAIPHLGLEASVSAMAWEINTLVIELSALNDECSIFGWSLFPFLQTGACAFSKSDWCAIGSLGRCQALA